MSTTAGDLELRIPKLRRGSFFPRCWNGAAWVDKSLFTVIMEAYLHGASTRKVDDLVEALGADAADRVSLARRRPRGLAPAQVADLALILEHLFPPTGSNTSC